MFYINPAIRSQFESMPIELRDEIRSMDVRLENMSDLISCLERIVAREKITNA
jgi:hypothetical protein